MTPQDRTTVAPWHRTIHRPHQRTFVRSSHCSTHRLAASLVVRHEAHAVASEGNASQKQPYAAVPDEYCWEQRYLWDDCQ